VHSAFSLMLFWRDGRGRSRDIADENKDAPGLICGFSTDSLVMVHEAGEKLQVRVDWIWADRSRVRRIALLKSVAAGILLCLLGVSVAAQPAAKNVLVVFSSIQTDHRPLELIESAVRARAQGQIDFYTVFLEHQRFVDKSYRERMAETLRVEYGQVKLNVVIAAGIEALQFATLNREKLFPGVPIVFFGLSAGELKDVKPVPEMTGLTTSPGLKETIDLAFRLDPDTTAVAIVDAAPLFWWRVAHAELLRRQDKVREIDIFGPPSTQMIDRVASLPPHTVILFQLSPPSSAEPAIGAFDVLDGAAQHMPTYSAWDTLCFNHGCIGGAYPDWQKNDLLAGDIAGRVLAGERSDDIPIVDTTNSKVQVDWRALKRWHIPESALPAGTLILNRPPTLWASYRKYVIVTIVVVSALLILVVVLLWERARKRKAEAHLRESEKRFRVMADTTPSLVWMCDREGRITYFNESRVAFTGSHPSKYTDDLWTEYIHVDDIKNVLDTVSQALDTRQRFSLEYRLRRSDGVYRWMLDVAAPRVNGDGSFGGFIGSGSDTTDQKLAQQALEKVSGLLIEAQETERSRIARDLHDDICQRLALLSLEIAKANRIANETSEKQRLQEIRMRCQEIARDVQSLSHQLHSSKLDYLGVVAAIRGFCEEFCRQHEVMIEITDANVPHPLPKDIALCLFRVAQEALHNAVKYSGTNQFTVEIVGMADCVQLVVCDAGAGFDMEAAKRTRGLGLVSMQERVHLVHGSFSVESRPGQGTKILVVVPLIAENKWSEEIGESKVTATLRETA
jgi:PAS domain S-box-containing protein